MLFPGNRIFPEKILEISHPKHSGTSSSWSRLSTGIQDWLLSGLVSGWETFRNSRTLHELKILILNLALCQTFFNVASSHIITLLYFGFKYREKSQNLVLLETFPSGTELFHPVPIISRIFPEFSRATGPENRSLVLVPPIPKMMSSLVLSRLIWNDLGNTDLYTAAITAFLWQSVF